MSAHALRTSNCGKESGFAPSLGVLGIYESARDLARMHYVFRELAGEPGVDVGIYYDWFDFKELKNGHLARRARQEAANADLILLSADTPMEPHSTATEWLGSCVAPEQMRQAKVDIPLDPGNFSGLSASPLRAYLRQVTRLPGADFLSRFAAVDPTGFAGPWMVARPDSRGVVFQFSEENPRAAALQAK